LTVNASAAVATILAVRRLFGVVSAIAAAALVTVYVSIGAPFVITNEWNPILPILPLALLTILAVPFARGDSTGLPALAVLASAIIQTHVGYGAPIAALAAVVLIARKRGGWTPVSRTSRLATAAVLAACWALPLYEAATARRESRETWPSAVAVVLHLHKRGLSIYVDDGWLYVVGDQFAAPDARHAELRFTTAAAVAEGPPDTGLTQIAASKDLVVSFMP
jgi:hypothetical protein